ncbi:MAG: hypothetical protein H6737_01450 [Alphaproteobacteria bacterium]|nr:hypothetical protein [Alphaproteobacteria bacterium]
MRQWMAALGLLAMAAPAFGAPPIRNGGNIGLGLGATPHVMGLDVKYWMNPNLSAQAVIGLYELQGGLDPVRVGIDGDVLYEIAFVKGNETFDFGMNLGIGGLYGMDFEAPSLVAGGNLVVGLEGNIDAVPLDLSIDYRPTVFLYDDFDDGFDTYRLSFVEIGGHIRYWF